MDDWSPCPGTLTLGAGEPNETLLDIEHGFGFVAVFAGQ
jgi:hypothetical protein